MARALHVTHPTPACTEHDLVAAVRPGDDRAFEELFSRYRGRIIAYIFGMVRDHGRAEDIAQEVFISALRRLRDTERPIAFKPWIYEIARNACVDEHRRARRAREVPLDDGDSDRPADRERDVVSLGPTPHAAVESKQRLEDLRGAFGGLSETHHRVLVLRELEGLSYTEIGGRMGMSRAVVESTLFRARRRLAEEYEELVTGRRCQRIHALIEAPDARSIRSLGVRERRRIARHLAHCQPCRRHARIAGLDDSLFKAPSVAAKIAALLPIPWLRWRRGAGDEDAVVGTSGSHSVALVQSLQTVGRVADQLGPSIGAGRAAVAAAALAVAGAGGGVVTGLTAHASHAATGAPKPAAAAARAPAPGGVLSVGRSPFARDAGRATPGQAPGGAAASEPGPGALLAPPPAASGAAGASGAAPGVVARSAVTGAPGDAGAGQLPSTPSAVSKPGALTAPPAPALPAPTLPAGGGSGAGATNHVLPQTPSVPSPTGAVTQPPHPVTPGGGGSAGSVPNVTGAVPGVTPPSVPGVGTPPVPGLGNGGQAPGRLGEGGAGGDVVASGQGIGRGARTAIP